MQERTLIRIGALSLFAGVVLFIIGIAPHPFDADPGDTKALLQSMGEQPDLGGHSRCPPRTLPPCRWGLLALYRSFTGEPGTTLARLGFAAALEGSIVTIAKPSELRIVVPTAFRRV